ncbi:hypothetical protein EC988_003492 [Linderina pennispora]|nr:hypothetical protein EC988_003492 [Linderina pennispora]
MDAHVYSAAATGAMHITPHKLTRPHSRLLITKKPKRRTPLQSIHIRALEHGWRVPVANTPLGVIGKDENAQIHTFGMPLRRPRQRTAPRHSTRRVLQSSGIGSRRHLAAVPFAF